MYYGLTQTLFYTLLNYCIINPSDSCWRDWEKRIHIYHNHENDLKNMVRIRDS